ncbi:MAG: 23S rRNA (pseudouridine(1915)-N(3))-methyltransferase RlmH [Anaeroplasmataceae bacterium]|nr:23S rRNA (pseudouridine(1915)-N(3))-methyltransferase RlmH [Anaeroplasmataceae bacterium]MDE6241866.1 23S rRNA (pseudouridine(1915)-N(3))-methyltransferase RlmH [Anaeroplasmataceae bacterium]MDE7384627.1 23S rRNA (pseudouridine(1915)-N(3))-methyltransferase RlmH [Anaeroplasmataceae bacterium]
MRITILSVGNIKEKYLKDAILEYSKRISKFCKVEFISVPDEVISDNTSETDIKNKEALKLLAKLPENSYKIALNLKGEMLTSPELAEKISHIFSYYNSHIVFVIGGSLGLGDELLKKMDYHLCFSKMTFPHQLMQVILLEQIYRSFKIINHETYHK